jgi:hypothetical protein
MSSQSLLITISKVQLSLIDLLAVISQFRTPQFHDQC